ncbi:Glycosyltransferase family 2 protein [Flavobacterium sp. 9R]|uniref:glycosyltransferase family 2 protein n=1 Tax=Flavobacterium sp. 9R TaxID=2653143 RepID=UPI0012F284C5|nr:glycosyltransferase family A protein [Flavobacterium sp. 9R]VXA96202.1 Glycosyltransferase family 2 protein [Flavobacterium sp. 9R]
MYTTKKPLISVVIPCYNHEKYVALCIENVLNQTYSNFEVIVIDDGSRDKSPEILKELKKIYDFTLILQENIGLPATLNKALKEFVKGEFFSICASDDFWCLNKLELQFNFMKKNTNIPMCYGKTHYIDENSIVIKSFDKKNNILKGGGLFNDIFTFKIHPPVNYFFKTSIFNEIGYFDENIFAEDYYMNLKIASKYEIGFIDEYLSYYRVDTSFDKINRVAKVSASHLMSIELYKDHPLYGKAKAMVYLSNFRVFSGFTRHKNLAIKNAVNVIGSFYNKNFVISCFKMIVIWR